MKEEADGVACYRLHETMREFARLKLAEAGEQEETEQRCAGYYRARCGRGRGPGPAARLLGWADLEIDNIRAVMLRCLDAGTSPRARAGGRAGLVLDHPRDHRRHALAGGVRRGAGR